MKGSFGYDKAIENHARVYLRRNPDENWEIDPLVLDGSPLFGLDDGDELNDEYLNLTPIEPLFPYVSTCEDDVNTVELPTGRELAVLLLETAHPDLIAMVDKWVAVRDNVAMAEEAGNERASDWELLDIAATNIVHTLADILKNGA